MVEAPCFTPGKNPLPMFVNTMSTKVFVAFLNSTEFQFSKEVRLASTCPSNTGDTAKDVDPGDLCRIMESKSFSFPSGIFFVVEELKSVKNSPCPLVPASAPEKDKVDPAKGEPVAETTPDVNVDDA